MFCWFASVYGAIAILGANLLRKKSVVVIGGVDIAEEREFGYGLWRSRWKSALVGKAIKTADKVLVVDRSLKNEVLDRVKYDGTNVEILPTGYDPNVWRPFGPKESIILTVAAIQDEGRLKIKGIDLLFDVARKLPHLNFMLIGFDPLKFPTFIPPSNLTCVNILDQSELLSYYQRSRIYCQPSRREGLSNTLCEAMLCGCIPVATDVGGSAQAIGAQGVLVRPMDAESLAGGIEQALTMASGIGLKARERIIDLFPKLRREKRLIELIRELGQ